MKLITKIYFYANIKQLTVVRHNWIYKWDMKLKKEKYYLIVIYDYLKFFFERKNYDGKINEWSKIIYSKKKN